MTDADRAALRTWAEAHAPVGFVQAKQVLDLLAEVAELESTRAALAASVAQVEEYVRLLRDRDAVLAGLAERVAAQSELLARRSEVPTTFA